MNLMTEDGGIVLAFATAQNGWAGVAFVRYGNRVKMVYLDELRLAA